MYLSFPGVSSVYRVYLCLQLDVKEAKKIESHPQWEISDDDEEKDADDEDGSESDISDYDESDAD